MKVEIFSSPDFAKCQNQVNQFLERCEKNQIKVQRVDFDTASFGDSDEVMYSVMITMDGQVPAVELLDSKVDR
jgi:hypothetical protein